MNASQWIFILAGIAGVIVLSIMGMLHVSGISRRREPARFELAPEDNEIRAVVREDSVDVLVDKLREAGANAVVSRPYADGGRVRVDVECGAADVDIYRRVIERANVEQGLGIERVDVLRVEHHEIGGG